MEYADRHLEKIKAVSPDIEIIIIPAVAEEINKYLPTVDVLIMSPLDHIKLIDFSKAKNLKWVHQTAAGTAPLVAKLKNTSIILTNSSGVHPIPIAEQVFTFILMLSRQFHQSFRHQIEDKRWIQDGIDSELRELYQSTIGIVGYGRIGKRVAKLAKAFDMKVVTLSRESSPKSDSIVDTFYQRDEVDKLLQESDYVVNSLPMTSETENYFDELKFSKMKSSGYFINIGRGTTVVEEDLIKVLKDKLIAGAGLDVFATEPLGEESELWKLKNVIMTPHYAGWTPKYIDRVIDIFCDNFKSYISQEEMPNLVDKIKGY